eukprot:s11356_g2.t1
MVSEGLARRRTTWSEVAIVAWCVAVRKLKEDRGMKEKQWKIYEQEAKAEYLKERKRFELALQKIDQEIKEVTGNGQEASKQVQALATNGLATKQARADNGREMWETMLAEPEAAPEPGFFRDALLAAQQAKAQPTAHSASGSAESGLMTAEAATQLLQATLAQLPSEVLRAMGTVPTAEPTLGPSWLLEAGQRQQHQKEVHEKRPLDHEKKPFENLEVEDSHP